MVNVDKVVDPDVGETLVTVAEAPAEPGAEQRKLQAKGSAAGGLHDPGAHPHQPDPAVLARRRGELPVVDPVGEETGAAVGAPAAGIGVLGEGLVATVLAVVPDGRGADQRLRPVR